MSKKDREKITIDKKKETRTKEISKMISEGGLGADRYYEIKKGSSEKTDENDAQKKNNDS